MGKLEKDERAKFGQTANLVKKELEDAISLRREKIAAAMQEKRFALEALDVTEPGVRKRPMGRLHPMTQTYRTIRDALVGMGFTTFDGPEVEYDEYNFTKLNLPKDHPARDMQDTFYVSERVVLRTHTSPCEARALLALEPPFRLVIPGRVFRVDEADASHSPVFMQMEGLVIDRNISLADLKGTIDAFVHAVFGEEVKTRFRPSYFPFTEPSAEVDISCTMCGGAVAACAKARAGSRSWAAASRTRTSSRTAASTRASGAHSPSDWAWTAWRASGTASLTTAFNMRTTRGSSASSKGGMKHETAA